MIDEKKLVITAIIAEIAVLALTLYVDLKIIDLAKGLVGVPLDTGTHLFALIIGGTYIATIPLFYVVANDLRVWVEKYRMIGKVVEP